MVTRTVDLSLPQRTVERTQQQLPYCTTAFCFTLTQVATHLSAGRLLRLM